jgi:lipoic acid synthetase
MSQPTSRKPDWLKVRFPGGPNYVRIDRYHRQQGLHSVCRSAACPNQGECWSRGTATFMILGDRCTRNCAFCNVAGGAPLSPDPAEPARVAQAVAELALRHAVVTSVTRDDLPDGGAGQFARLVAAVREAAPGCRVELLIPDLQGDRDALATVLTAGPDVLGHNLETVPRLYPAVRQGASYERSLRLLARARELAPQIPTKSGLMLGLGESREEVLGVLADLRRAGCALLTLGQYLAPTRRHHPVERYVPPEEFAELRREALSLGFAHVEAGPLVRSSYHAEEQFAEAGHGG